MAETLRVAVVGARKFGRHHVKWFLAEGCEVTAIFGTTRETATATAAELAETLGFRGEPYWDWDAFCRSDDFTAVSVCTPADRHYEHVTDLLRAEKDVLCEKPLVWNWSHPPDRIVSDARALADLARATGRVLAVNAQYPAAVGAIRQLRREVLGEDRPFSRLECLMQTKGEPRSDQGAADGWVDLAPHLIAFVDALAGGGGIAWETLRCETAGLRVDAAFDWVGAREVPGGVLPVRLVTERVPGGQPLRRFSDGEVVIDYEGRNVDGRFVAVLRAGERERITTDFMQTSIQRFIAAARAGDPRLALVPAEAAARHVEALAGVWARCLR